MAQEGMSSSAMTGVRESTDTDSTLSAGTMTPSTPDSSARVTSFLLKGTLLK